MSAESTSKLDLPYSELSNLCERSIWSPCEGFLPQLCLFHISLFWKRKCVKTSVDCLMPSKCWTRSRIVKKNCQNERESRLCDQHVGPKWEFRSWSCHSLPRGGEANHPKDWLEVSIIAVWRDMAVLTDDSLMPLLTISYAFQYLDKTSLSYSAVLGIKEDLVSLIPLQKQGDTDECIESGRSRL